MDIMSFALYHEEDPSKKRKTVEDDDDMEEEEMNNENMPPAAPKIAKKAATDSEPKVDEFDAFRSALNRMFAAAISATGDPELAIAEIIDQTGADSDKAAKWLEELQDENVLMVNDADNTVMQV